MHSPLFLLGLASTLGSLSHAHTVMTTLFVNEVNQGDGTCVRMEMNGNTVTGPVRGVNDSPNMACGREGQNPVAFTCPAAAGDKLTFEFREWADYAQQGVIDAMHKGPAAVYVKQVSNMKTDSAAGDGWFKIWDEGYDSSSKLWATEKLIAAKGLLSIKVPTGLPTGYYLFRTELLTFQNVTNNYVDPQFYINCAQLYITGTSSTPLSIPSDRKVSIPGHVQLGQKSLHFNIYDTPLKLPYTPPGPSPFIPTSDTKAVKSLTTYLGAVPANCLIKNANWCAFEVPSYTTESGCWASLKNCYDQLDVCYKTFPPSGAKGCDAWDKQKCKVIDAACHAGQFTGPPNKDKKLTDASSPLPGPIPAARDEPTGAGEPSGGEPSEDEPPAAEPTVSTLPVEGAPGGEVGGEESVSVPAPAPSTTTTTTTTGGAAIPSSVYLELPGGAASTSASATSNVSPATGLPTATTFSTVAKPTKSCGGGGVRTVTVYKKSRKGKKSV